MGFLSVAMGALQMFGASKAADAAVHAAKAQAGTENRITDEKLFRLGQEERSLAGKTRATAAGSGVKADIGSPVDILQEQAANFARQRGFISEVGASRADQTMQRGRDQASATRFAGMTSALSSFGGAASATASNKSFFKFG